MLYWLSFLSSDLSFLNVFKYITFRTGGAIFFSFFVCLLIGPKVIGWLRVKQKKGQPIRTDGPASHMVKAGTPTMGGLMIVISILSSILFWANWGNPYVWLLLFVLTAFGFIGFMDDYLKLSKQNSKGVSAKVRLLYEFGISLVACLWVMYLERDTMSTALMFPFFKNFFLDLGYFYIPFVLVVMVGASNAVNLTDGLDGLVSVPVIMCTLVFLVISYLVGNVNYANYLQVHYIAGAGEMAVVCGAMIGGVLGFLWFNAPPAKVFMGDTGSLALGGVLGVLSVVTKHEIVLAIAGGIFVIEALSDIIQVGSYKLRKKRVFLMAPIHHHFEKKGMPETTVVVRFWIVSILLALLALATLKLR